DKSDLFGSIKERLAFEKQAHSDSDKHLLALSVFFIVVSAILPAADFTVPPLSEEQKAARSTQPLKRNCRSCLLMVPTAARCRLLDTIAKAAEADPEGFKAAIVKAFNNLPESAKQEMMKLKAQ
ncbi:hypothetical protein PRIPAC_93436, partial [Pristionchus pacificus]|uniref:Uncharacterized protein n=1 Tax=Pristionchus pacificus TaxID=54126 RepID=A0A2A6CHI5_PRIPA